MRNSLSESLVNSFDAPVSKCKTAANLFLFAQANSCDHIVHYLLADRGLEITVTSEFDRFVTIDWYASDCHFEGGKVSEFEGQFPFKIEKSDTRSEIELKVMNSSLGLKHQMDISNEQFHSVVYCSATVRVEFQFDSRSKELIKISICNLKSLSLIESGDTSLR
ncbi:MAG: hypothetical protein IT342_26510 [Candidatus Melainabacteria bacterium]|nr:hypothetical protein [Candidatus Melainabacteria bacterium]